MELHYSKNGNGPNLLILHGLYGSGNNWLHIGKALSEYFTVYLIDLRNHGKSGHSFSFNYDEMASDIKELCDNLNLKNIYLLGHSMGGKAAMTFTLKYPGIVEKLIIVDITPYSFSDTPLMVEQLNFHKRIIDTFLSTPLDKVKSRSEVDIYFKNNIPDKSVRSFLLKNLTRTSSNKFIWKLNIDSISKNIEFIMGAIPPLKLGIQSYIPVFFLKGEKSPYISQEDIKNIPDVFPNAKFTTIKKAGHWLHAEYPDIFLKLTIDFLIKN